VVLHLGGAPWGTRRAGRPASPSYRSAVKEPPLTNADWWARVVERTRTEREELLPKRVWAPDLKAVPGIGAEIVLTVAGQWRKTRLFRSHQQAELVGAIADTPTMFEGKGWA
jgi:hypothetical protein